MLIDPDGMQIDPSELMKSEDHAEAFILFAKTEEGKAFLDQYASEGQELSHNGEVYYKAGEAGEYDKKGVDLEYTSSSVEGRSGTRVLIGENRTRIRAEIDKNGFGFGTDKTMNLVKAIGHESFLHVNLFTEDVLDDGKDNLSNLSYQSRRVGYTNGHHAEISEQFLSNPRSNHFDKNMNSVLQSVSNQLNCGYSNAFIRNRVWTFYGSRVNVNSSTGSITRKR